MSPMDRLTGRSDARFLLPYPPSQIGGLPEGLRDPASGPDRPSCPGGPVHPITELPELLPRADVVILTVPLTPHTRGMVDADFLARMPDRKLLVNVSRGPVVDTGALLAELGAGRLGAALDVTDPELLPAGHPPWYAPTP